MSAQNWRKRGLELEESGELRPKPNAIRHAMWVVTSSFLALATLGLFGGGGPLDRTVIKTDDVEIELHRFMRFNRPSTLRVRVDPRMNRGAEQVVELSGDVIRDVQLEKITPIPLGAQTEGNVTRYRFAVAPGRSSEMSFYFSPETPGLYRSTVTVGEGRPLSFTQFAYP